LVCDVFGNSLFFDFVDEEHFILTLLRVISEREGEGINANG
jgi:hypothetical protein